MASAFFKDSPELGSAPLAPSRPIPIPRDGQPSRIALASTYNRLGGLIESVAAASGVEPPAVLAVWQVESGGGPHQPGAAWLRLECHLLYRGWGQDHPDEYGRHFRHGGFQGQPGKAWENHLFRTKVQARFEPVHAGQRSEYRALALARSLAGAETALAAASIGGPQILMSAYAWLGYDSPLSMYEAFQAGERAHVLGFFDFCATKPAPNPGHLLRYLALRRWHDFAAYYNGPGKAAGYARLLRIHYQMAREVLTSSSPPDPLLHRLG